LNSIELDKRTNLLEMMPSEPFTQFIGDDDKLMMAATATSIIRTGTTQSSPPLL